MPRPTSTSTPAVTRVLAELGNNIRLARMRRRLPASLVAERAGMSRPTLRSIERGDRGVTLGAIANVLFSLGLHADLAAVARADAVGRHLEDAELEARTRVRR
nr:helix-turn-helix transcriptional regulator [Kofleriaceae bacterium]